MRSSTASLTPRVGMSRVMGRQKHVYQPTRQEFPEDFPERLERFRDDAGLSWRGLARHLRLDARSVRRWRNGTKPSWGHLYALFNLAAEKGLLGHFLPAVAEREAAEE